MASQQAASKPLRDERGRLLPGGTANPGGRARMPLDAKVRLTELTVEAVERLAFWMRSKHPSASVTAAKEILDRRWGRTVQPTEDVTALRRRAEELAREYGQDVEDVAAELEQERERLRERLRVV